MPEGEIKPPQNFVERLIPKTAERLSPLEVRVKAWGIAQFYKTPEKATAKGLNSEVYFISSSEIAGIAFEESKRRTGSKVTKEEFLASKNKGRKQAEMFTFEEAMGIGGVTLQWNEDKSLIYLNKEAPANKTRLRHELIHAMAMDADGGAGFTDFDFSKGGSLNEAVVEALEFFQRAKTFLKGNLANIQYIKGGDEENESFYHKELGNLGFIIECTQDTKPLTAFDLAKVYFDPTKTPEQRRRTLKEMALEKINPDGRWLPEELFEKLVS